MTPSARGWLPVAINWDTRAKQTVVRWLEFSSTKPAEPFFSQTVKKLRLANPPAREAQTGLDVLIDLAAGLAPATPAGFIFHVSACGSTLIANALKTGTAVVFSEAASLSILLHPDAELFVSGSDASWDEIRPALIHSVVRFFANYRAGQPEPVIIKFPSWNILSWSLVRSCWPGVPCLVVIRDPIEVMTANLGGGSWMEFRKSPGLVHRMFGWRNLARPVEQMSGAEYAARVLRSFYTCAAEMAGEQTRILDYRDIDAEEIRSIAAFFGMTLPVADGQVEQILGTYAKDPKARPFHPDSQRKQALATGLIRSAAHQWATPAYRKLALIN